ncbi:transcriptional regulator family: GATA type zinc finger [Penicillium psychrosexuale]|uniref:transcriptional regulator family: GATA type zinc finger n=1 Tax=Penicillium psychrosexuale TaxID=1002107 RepID=UPI0025459849|nr:transcriptional regulator family: GATA type zinc finger [Penicillium psychrosexuale]KAJ5790116.1 transcriptional regulator family: GATA type zinc finger [Penicillium psychrosexuale]
MGSLEAASRHRDPLPAMSFLGKDGSGYTSRHPSSATASPTLMSPNVMYGQSLPYAYANAPPGYISSPEARRALEDEKEKRTSRQSLPSIHEALGNDPLPYPAATSAPPPQSSHPTPPPHLIGRPSAEGPAGPPNPFSNGPPTGSLMREPAYHQQLQDASRSSLASINTQDSRTSLNSLSTGKSPTQSAKTGITSVGSQNSSGYEYSAPTSAGSVASPNGYGHFPPNYSFQPQSGHSYPPAPGPYDNRAYMGAPRVEEVKGGFVSRLAPHNESKRHLDVYDVETSLNELADLSTRTLDFSRHYASRAHQTQLEDMLHMQRRNQDALIRIRTAVVNQEQALAEQMAQRKAFKTEDDHMAMYQEDFKGTGGFAGADPKKRRGKAAPPGRCHSCNRAETPEWRRGPDGARTLCNACGLHYAKLTRKMGAHKAASLGSNLKPKSVLDSSSPTSH